LTGLWQRRFAVNGLELSDGFIVGEGLFQFVIELSGGRKTTAFAQFAFGIDLQEFLGHLPDRLGHLVLGTAPLARTQLVKFRFLVGESLVAVDPVQPVRRDIELVAAPIFDISGQPVAAISVSGPAARLEPIDGQREVIEMTLKAAQEISRRLGYRGAEP